MHRLYVPLPEAERAALLTLAHRELRRPQEQAAVLLVEALRRTAPPRKDEAEPAVTGPASNTAIQPA
jgi:hypothetical protein